MEEGIARVVVGSDDPNPLVSGKGFRILREHGIEVVPHFLKEECDAINDVFFHFIRTGRPYVAMKYAMTMDGKIACHTGDSKWVTGEEARAHVQSLRNHYKGIMAGIGTVLADDPTLNCRMEGGRDPIRIICDSHLRIPMDSNLVNTAYKYPLIVACLPEADEGKAAELEACQVEVLRIPPKDGTLDLNALMVELGNRKIDGILLEGGGTLNESALRSGIVSRAYCYVAPKMFGGKDAKTPVEGSGIRLPQECAKLRLAKITVMLNDMLLEYDVEGETECSPE